jgi:hypothetical protein
MSIPPGHFQNISLQDQEPEGLEGLKRRENIKKRRENIIKGGKILKKGGKIF